MASQEEFSKAGAQARLPVTLKKIVTPLAYLLVNSTLESVGRTFRVPQGSGK